MAAAHAHDFANSDERVELSASLLFFYALGAIAAPLFASSLIGFFGPNAMFIMIACAHLILVIFGVTRMRARPTLTEKNTLYLRAENVILDWKITETSTGSRKKIMALAQSLYLSLIHI